MKSKIVVVGDSDGLIAIISEEDAHHEKAMEIVSYFIQSNVLLLFPTTAIIESITTLQRKLKKPQLCVDIIEEIERSQLATVPIDSSLIKEALSLFNPGGSKKNTLFDAIVAATAKQYKTTLIFSFDVWYEKIGMKLVGREVFGENRRA